MAVYNFSTLPPPPSQVPPSVLDALVVPSRAQSSDYPKNDYRYEHEMLGISQTHLHMTILKMATLGLRAIYDMNWITKPSAEVILGSWNDLRALGCLDDQGELTHLGHHVAQLPLEPEHAVAVYEAIHLQCVDDVVRIVCLSAGKSIFLNPKGKMAAKAAKMLHGRWSPLQGHQFGLLNVWRAYSHEARATSRTLTGHQFTQHMVEWCAAGYSSYQELRRAAQFIENVMSTLRGQGHILSNVGNNDQTIRRALLRGLFPQVAVKAPATSGDRYHAYVTVLEPQNGPISTHSKLLDLSFDLIVFDKSLCAIAPFFKSSSRFPQVTSDLIDREMPRTDGSTPIQINARFVEHHWPH